MFTNFRNHRGVALLITISVTTILVAAALEYNRRARFAVTSAAMARNRVTLSQMAASGVHVAMALLVKDKMESQVDTLQEDWANPEKIEELMQAIPFEDGTVSVVISDEMAKIQVNALVNFPQSNEFNEAQSNLWDRFLRNIRSEEELQDDSEPTAIINSVKDWLDSGDDDAITGLTGAESSYYQALDPPYSCRNGPIPDLQELLMIKGITPEIFYGSEESPGISKYMTVYGATADSDGPPSFPGKININTAELPVLVALLPSENVELVQAFLEFRQEAAPEKEGYDFSNPTWYKNILGFADVNIDPNLITVSSDIFRIEATATLQDAKLTTTAVVQRQTEPKSGKWFCKILSWQNE
jgi:general secretion pathway protein K